MDEKETQYRKVFLFQKRLAKHWQTHSAHRAHSSTQGMIEPAKRTLAYIELIDTEERTYKIKLELLDAFFDEQDSIGRGSCNYVSYYSDAKSINKRSYNSINNGEPVFIPKLSN
jgi:hypothetical protein